MIEEKRKEKSKGEKASARLGGGWIAISISALIKF